MSVVPKNVVELRRVLAEKFPGVKMTAEPRARLSRRWESGMEGLDRALDGGLAKSALTELVTGGVATGSALIVAGLIERARRNGQWLALIDGADSFDPAALDNAMLEQVLWLRCPGPREALKAADLVLHDGTAAVAVLDLAFCPLAQLRRTPSSTWFRLERLVEQRATALLVMTPEAMISNAETRLRLEPRYGLEAIDQTQATLFSQLAPERVKGGARLVKTA